MYWNSFRRCKKRQKSMRHFLIVTADINLIVWTILWHHIRNVIQWTSWFLIDDATTTLNAFGHFLNLDVFTSYAWLTQLKWLQNKEFILVLTLLLSNRYIFIFKDFCIIWTFFFDFRIFIFFEQWLFENV